MEQTKCKFDVDDQKLIGRLDEIVDFSHGIPVKRVNVWIKSGELNSSLYSLMSTVRNANSLASVFMDLSLYGWTIDSVHIDPYDCSEVGFWISKRCGKYNTNITPEVVESLMGLTWGVE